MSKTQTKTRDEGLFGAQSEQTIIPPEKKVVAPTAKPKGKNAIATRTEAPPPAVLSEFEQTIAMFERAIRDPAVDVSKAREIRAMMKEIEAERAEGLFNEAMAVAQSEIGMVAVDRSNKQTNSRYASYPALDRAIRPVYSKHGFALSFDTEADAPADHVRVVCFVSCARHTRKYRIDMPADGKGAKGGDVMTRTHAAGSAVSYGMRYLLKMIFNIATGEDDDGNKAGKKAKDTDGDVILISKEQLASLAKAIEFCEVGERQFCAFYKIAKVPDLPAELYERAMEDCRAFAEKHHPEKTSG